MKDIIFSLSKIPPGEAKSVSTGFSPAEYDDLSKIADQWNKYSISSAIYSQMWRYDKYKKILKVDSRRRIHNISFIGNTFIYDFDDGHISMADFIDQYKGKFRFLAVKSKNDHKYDYDRFKVMLVHDTIFVQSTKTDPAPDGYEVLNINQYQDLYIGLAEQYGFWKYADQSTTDLCRLASNVAKEYIVCD